MPANTPNNNGSSRFMPKADENDDNQSEPNLLSDDPETPSVLADPEQIETADGGGGEKLPKQKSGAGKWILIVLLVLIVGGSLGYLYYNKTKQNNADLAAKQAQIAALEAKNAKLEEDKNTAVVVSKDSNSDYIVIKEWKVRFKPNAAISDTAYAVKSDQFAYFSTTSLMGSALTANKKPASGSLCDVTEGAIGGVSRGKKGEEVRPGVTFESVTTAKKVGDYYFVLDGPQSSCSDDKKTSDLQTAQIKLLKDSFTSLEATK